ncbi:hypothetical protein ACFLVS_06520 [Chloroflexota bacterium]
MRLSKADKEAKIIELYKAGWSYRQLQKRYYISLRDIAHLVKGIEVECAICGKPKGGIRFHAYHPDRVNQPDYTIPLCPSCHATEEARLRKEKQGQSQAPVADTPQPINIESHPSTALPAYPPHPLSNKVIVGSLITLVTLEALPDLLDDIRRHLQQSNKLGRRPIMGLKRSDLPPKNRSR